MKLLTKGISLSLVTTIFLNLKRGHYKAEFLNIQLHSSIGIYFSNIILNSFAKIKLLGLYLTLYVIQKKTRQIFIYNFLFPWTPKEFFLVKKFEFRLTSIIFLLSDYFPQLNGERSTHCTFTTCSTIFFLFCSATYIIVCIHRLSHFSTLLIFPSFIKKKLRYFYLIFNTFSS